MASDHEKLTYKTDMGQKANVNRDELKGSGPEMANARLRQIGKGLEEMVSPDNMPLEYVGSAAVHVYRGGETFKIIEYVSQTAPLNEVPEHVASSALDALRKDLQYMFGRDRQILRSGF